MKSRALVGGLRRPEGFSLVELLVVVAILAILVGFGASTLATKKGAEVAQAGGLVSDLANLARQHALSKNTKTILVVAQIPGSGGTHSAVSIWDAATTNQLERWNMLPQSVVATNTSGFVLTTFPCTYRGTSVSSGDCYVFFPDGRMGDNLNQRPKLEVRARNGNSDNFYELVFNPLTGLTKVNRP